MHTSRVLVQHQPYLVRQISYIVLTFRLKRSTVHATPKWALRQLSSGLSTCKSFWKCTHKNSRSVTLTFACCSCCNCWLQLVISFSLWLVHFLQLSTFQLKCMLWFCSPLYSQIGSFFMINLCLVVIATQFSETKKREMERMRQERARYTSTSTLASSTNNSEPATCYAEIVKYIAHLWRRFKRRMLKKYRLYKYAACPFLVHSIRL